MKNTKLIKELNNALSLELRAIILYSHYSAYVQGIHRIHLSAHFNNEATESIGHANIVRSAIVKLGGVAVTERNTLKIKHTKNYIKMLEEAYETEKRAAQCYFEILKKTKSMVFVNCTLKKKDQLIASATGVWKVIRQI